MQPRASSLSLRTPAHPPTLATSRHEQSATAQAVHVRAETTPARRAQPAVAGGPRATKDKGQRSECEVCDLTASRQCAQCSSDMCAGIGISLIRYCKTTKDHLVCNIHSPMSHSVGRTRYLAILCTSMCCKCACAFVPWALGALLAIKAMPREQFACSCPAIVVVTRPV